MSSSSQQPLAMYSKSLAMIDDLIYKLQNNQPLEIPSSSSSSLLKTNTLKEQSKRNNNTSSSSKPPKTTQKKDNKPSTPSIPPSPFHQTYIVVAKIESVEKHPESEKLYKMTLSVGGQQGTTTRNLVAGLRKFYSEDQLLHRKVLAILNLKPKKLAGVVSEAMVLAGSCGSGDDDEKVRVLDPAEEAQVGDRVILKTDFEHWKNVYVSSPEERCSPNQWEKIVKELAVLDGQPSYAKQILCVASQQPLKVKCELPDGGEIH
ncbi:hypothetical protein FDP41_012434 [Naegleria fowleri]|uniref:tRNA-binding domain-containing protein n=1 Tax=Naegleria fowleri TaxID=5763 RepID=A0A6A5BWY6_NAEFO|nr:uncharacterized protein FDP41_012434 [Naegleria fowleri]KAF0981777.1 hypothetical protein FDP41_012434 [Naegleria fowleri]